MIPNTMCMRLLSGVLLVACSIAAAAAPTLDDRKAAADVAAAGSACAGLNFYWEIGDKDGNKRFGNGPGGTASSKVQPTDQGLIASAGKWLYGAYVLQRSNMPLDPVYDIPYLNMTSGYHALKSCALKTSIASCGDTTGMFPNNPYTAADVGKFYYDSGHFEAHAAKDWSHVGGLASLNKAELATTIASTLNIDSDHKVANPDPKALVKTINVGLKYAGYVLAGDASIDAATYVKFLQQVLNGALKMGQSLSTPDDVCASTGKDSNGAPFCPNTVQASGAVPPLPAALDAGAPADGDPWKYSLGHWIEKDGTYSSPGAFGFYPWIDASKTWYGVVARYAAPNELAYQQSVLCGRALRNAWLTAPAR